MKYTKVRDLTDEELAVAPTAIALYNGETEVTEPIALDATANTVTLTPSYTPENASEGYLTWTSSDESVATVANGVVTAVSPGTATITATSTLDATVSASVTVTVTYPEATVPVTAEFINETEMTKTIYTLSQTNLVKNGSFEYPDAYFGWTVGTGAKMTSSQFTLETKGAVDGSQYIQSVLHNGSNSAGALRQAWAIETGKKYVLGYWLKNTSGSQVNANDWFRVSLCNTNPTNGDGTLIEKYPSYNGDWTKFEVVVDNTESEYTFVQVHNRWLGENGEHTSFDNFYLAEVTNTEVIDLSATAEDYAALNAAIENAPVLGFLAGEAAPYANVEAAKALVAAKAINQNAKNLAETVQAATTALNSVTWVTNTEEVNAVYDGTFAAATNNGAPAGWTMSNNTLGGSQHARAFNPDDRLSEFNTTNSAFFIRFDGTNSDRGSLYYYGKTEGYTMPLKAGVTYYVKADVKGWGSTGKNQRMNITGPDGFTALNQILTLSDNADTDDKVPQQFLIVFEATVDGNYVINFQTPGDDSQKHMAVVSNIELKTASQATMTVKAGKYGTFVAPFDVTIPEGVEAYTVDEVTTNVVKLAAVEGSTLSAQTPVILKNTTEELVEETFYGKSETTADTEEGTYLVGVYKAGLTIPAGNYVLQTDTETDTQAFYVVEGEFTSSANRCYLTNAVSGANVRSISVAGEATGIDAIGALTSGNYDAIYTANGTKVESLQKGLNIVVKDGKSHKIFVK